MSISGISLLLLILFWGNFKGRFLWTFRTDSNCKGDICPHNICPRDICPYQEYLCCYWPDFDETLKAASWEHLEQIPTIKLTFVQATSVHIMNSCYWPDFYETLKVATCKSTHLFTYSILQIEFCQLVLYIQLMWHFLAFQHKYWLEERREDESFYQFHGCVQGVWRWRVLQIARSWWVAQELDSKGEDIFNNVPRGWLWNHEMQVWTPGSSRATY